MRKKLSGNLDAEAEGAWNFIEHQLDRVFPAHCDYVTEPGAGAEKIVKKVLFGQMIRRVAAFIEKDVDSAVQMSSAKRAKVVSHASAHDNSSLAMSMVPDSSPSQRITAKLAAKLNEFSI